LTPPGPPRAAYRLRAMEVLLQVSESGPQASACFETLGIDAMIEQSLRSEEELEVLNALEVACALPIERLRYAKIALYRPKRALSFPKRDLTTLAHLSMAAIASLLADVVASWAVRGGYDEAAPEGVSLLHERRLHAIARHWAKVNCSLPMSPR
jgi:hypothetical protein